MGREYTAVVKGPEHAALRAANVRGFKVTGVRAVLGEGAGVETVVTLRRPEDLGDPLLALQSWFEEDVGRSAPFERGALLFFKAA